MLLAFQTALEQSDVEGIRKGWPHYRADNADGVGKKKKRTNDGKLLLPHFSGDMARAPKRSYAQPMEFLFARYASTFEHSHLVAIYELMRLDKREGPSGELMLSNLLASCGVEDLLGYRNPSIHPQTMRQTMRQDAIIRMLASFVKSARMGWDETRRGFWVRCFLGGRFREHGQIMAWIVANRMTNECATRAIHEKLRLAMRRNVVEYQPQPTSTDEIGWLLGRFPAALVRIDERRMSKARHPGLPVATVKHADVPKTFGLLHEVVLWYSYVERAKAAHMLQQLLEQGGADPWAVDSMGRTAVEVLRTLRCEDVMCHFRYPVKCKYEQRKHEVAERACFERLMVKSVAVLETFAAKRPSPAERAVTLAMGLHPRLGGGSILFLLDSDLLRTIMFEHTWPHTYASPEPVPPAPEAV